jgi:hypothetical protein
MFHAGGGMYDCGFWRFLCKFWLLVSTPLENWTVATLGK